MIRNLLKQPSGASKKNISAFIQKFFLQRLMAQQNVSPETVKSYRDGFRIYLKYLETAHGITPSAITVNCLEAEYILEFLDFLENERGNQPKTINLRLSALSSFLRFLSFEVPEYSGLVNRSLMIPYRKEEKRQMDFLTKDEYQALLNACEQNSELGRRDRLMLLLLYNTGIRVSELVELKVQDINIDANGLPLYVHIRGKGRKVRDVPFMEKHRGVLA